MSTTRKALYAGALAVAAATGSAVVPSATWAGAALEVQLAQAVSGAQLFQSMKAAFPAGDSLVTITADDLSDAVAELVEAFPSAEPRADVQVMVPLCIILGVLDRSEVYAAVLEDVLVRAADTDEERRLLREQLAEACANPTQDQLVLAAAEIEAATQLAAGDEGGGGLFADLDDSIFTENPRQDTVSPE